ncbi:hypothetical protein GWI33_015702 [Rhynchophorus ferrugineus]|uniref:Uncharacterized protein n=1 Tax=Rhynchophorus ferrugineus TaxID=354439 RepID=A0A834I2X2_RHYFE|nr:hypothetical protein GWI33_015702 [Rhynchophorus ferrugineus]
MVKLPKPCPLKYLVDSLKYDLKKARPPQWWEFYGFVLISSRTSFVSNKFRLGQPRFIGPVIRPDDVIASDRLNPDGAIVALCVCGGKSSAIYQYTQRYIVIHAGNMNG